MRSQWAGARSVCHEHFPIGTPIARKGSGYIHSTCAPGGDDD